MKKRRTGPLRLAPFVAMAASQVVFATGLACFVPTWIAALLGAGGFALLVRRWRTIWADPPRPRWVTWLVDEPSFVHFAASAGALLSFFPALLGAWSLSALELGSFGPGEAAALAYGVSWLFAAFGVWVGRKRVTVREIEVVLDDLPPVFEGYRIAQISDLHIGTFDRLSRGLAWARLANEKAPDLAVCTGDLVTSGTAHYADAAEVVGALRARDGVFAVLGNHDQWDADLLSGLLEQRGVRVLRNDWTTIEREQAAIVIAGLDDRFAKRDDLHRTLARRPAGVPTILLSHYPSQFDAAAALGVELVLSGHTHNGQIGLPLLGDRWNFARVTGQATRGLTRRGKSQLYVSAGLGTSGLPLRLGVLPEVAVIVLRKSTVDSRRSTERA